MDDDLDLLIGQAKRGDLDAFDRIVELVEPELRACVAAHAVRPHQIDEIVQDALVQAYRKLAQYQGSGAFVAWVKAIARNRLRMELRQASRAPGMRAVEAELIDARLAGLDAPHESESRIARLRSCLDRLDDSLRHLVESHHLHGIGLEDLARQLARTPNWVAVRLYRVRRVLAGCMESADG